MDALTKLEQVRRNRSNEKLMRLFPGLADRTPYEVILEYAGGERSWEETLEELAVWPYTYSEDAEPGNPLTERTWGTWSDVTLAHHVGRITTAQYWQLYWRVHPNNNDERAQ